MGIRGRNLTTKDAKEHEEGPDLTTKGTKEHEGTQAGS
jgi:hypothetical protein